MPEKQDLSITLIRLVDEDSGYDTEYSIENLHFNYGPTHNILMSNYFQLCVYTFYTLV